MYCIYRITNNINGNLLGLNVNIINLLMEREFGTNKINIKGDNIEWQIYLTA